MAHNFEVRYWMQVFGVSKAELVVAVEIAGTNADDVRRWFLRMEDEPRTPLEEPSQALPLSNAPRA